MTKKKQPLILTPCSEEAIEAIMNGAQIIAVTDLEGNPCEPGPSGLIEGEEPDYSEFDILPDLHWYEIHCDQGKPITLLNSGADDDVLEALERDKQKVLGTGNLGTLKLDPENAITGILQARNSKFNSVIKSAQDSQASSGCPASVTLAQWALESGYGKYTPPGSNNYFGIKAAPGQPYVETKTWEVIRGQNVIITARFRKFATIKDGFDAHGRLLTSPKGPYRAFLHWINDPIKWVQKFASTYATDLRYAEKIISIMNTNDLLSLDKK